jgi:kynurenine formamidase
MSAPVPGSGGTDSFPTYAELRARPEPLTGTAWGVFGAEDELGTLNHLTPDRVRAAASSIRRGDTFALNLSLTAFDPPLIAHRGSIEHHVFGLNEFHRDERIDSLFTQASTQIDGLRHFAHPDRGFYNGVDGAELVAGTDPLGIQHVAERGIVGRGVLIDVGAYRDAQGRPIDDGRSEQIDVDDLDATLAWQGVTLEPGDIALIRFGWLDRMRRTPREAGAPLTSAGLAHTERTAAWLWDKRIAMVAADNVALEAWPVRDSEIVTEAEARGTLAPSSHTGMLHRILIPLLGITIGELWDLDALAAACHRERRYDVFLVAEPLNIRGGVGSPANAVAII